MGSKAKSVSTKPKAKSLKAKKNEADVGHSGQKPAPEKRETGDKESVVVRKETGGVNTTEKSSTAQMQHGEMGVEAAEPMDVASCAGNEEKLTTPKAGPENAGKTQPPSGSDESRPAETTAVHKGALKTRQTARCVKTWSVVLSARRPWQQSVRD